MENFGKRALPHLIGLFAYSVFSSIMTKPQHPGIIYLGFIIVIHVIICFGIAMVKFFSQESQAGKQYLLITFLVLIIGFGTCVSFFTLNIH
jgi:hypothetical protein